MSKGLYKRKDSPNWYVNKVYRGIRLTGSTGTRLAQEAEDWVEKQCQEIKNAQIFGVRPPHTFREAATRYLNERLGYKSAETLAYHIEILDPWIGDLDMNDIYDENLEPFKQHRLNVDGVRPATLKKPPGGR